MAIRLGPVLQFRGCTGSTWRFSALIVTDIGDDIPPLKTVSPLQQGNTVHLADIPFSNPRYRAWRMELSAAPGSGLVTFELAGKSYPVHIPAVGQAPKMAYVSCNGFSDPKLMKSVTHPNANWSRMRSQHDEQGYHLLLMGGDQVYSDSIWGKVSALKGWLEKSVDQRQKVKLGTAALNQIDSFFAELYIERWAQQEPAAMMAAVPTVMMWDDHDIMDGWGSYPEKLHGSDVHKGIFAAARRYFHLFQQQLKDGGNEVHPASIDGTMNLQFAGLGNVSILALDLRSERQPKPMQIIAPDSWDKIYAWLEGWQPQTAHEPEPQHLLILSSIPLAYLDLSYLESLLQTLPGQQELEDDLLDHWRSEAHRQERLRFIHRLFDLATEKHCRITLLSGDVHVGAYAVIESQLARHKEQGKALYQLVSSGVVHPVPPALVRYVLESVAGREELVEKDIRARQLPLTRKGNYLLGQRNWLSIEPDEEAQKGRLWCKWYQEDEDEPICKVINWRE